MQTLPLHHSGPLGGVLEESERHQIVEMRLRAGNEIPPYQSPATIILITLSGSAEIHSSAAGPHHQPRTAGNPQHPRHR